MMAGRRQRDPQLEQFWRRMVADREQSGATVRSFCARLRLKEANFYAWRQELAKRDRLTVAPTFVPVRVVRDAAFEVVLPSGVVVRVPATAEFSAAVQLIAALGAPSC
jgi:transposase-like protein